MDKGEGLTQFMADAIRSDANREYKLPEDIHPLTATVLTWAERSAATSALLDLHDDKDASARMFLLEATIQPEHLMVGFYALHQQGGLWRPSNTHRVAQTFTAWPEECEEMYKIIFTVRKELDVDPLSLAMWLGLSSQVADVLGGSMMVKPDTHPQDLFDKFLDTSNDSVVEMMALSDVDRIMCALEERLEELPLH